VIHPSRDKSTQILNEFVAGTLAVPDNPLRPSRASWSGFSIGAHGSEYPSARESRQTDRAHANCAGAALDQHRPPCNWSRCMNCSMCGDARNAEASALLE
jgi:hypothetical protein